MTDYAYQPLAAPQQQNTLGIVGFVCSLAGLLLTGGLLSPVGLIISLIALGRQPRGFAVAGIVLGAIGACGWGLIFIIFGIGIFVAILAAIGIAAIALSEPQRVELTADLFTIAAAAERYKADNNGVAPAGLEVLGLKEPTLIDPWGQRYQYTLIEDEPGYDIISAGEDKSFGNLDDIQLTRFEETWEGIKVSGSNGGTVRVRVGDRDLVDIRGDDGGKVKVDLGDRVIEVEGAPAPPGPAPQSGRPTEAPDMPEAPDEAETPDAPVVPDEPASPPDDARPE